MKKHILILSVMLPSMAVFAQGKFSVPVQNDLQKYQVAAIQWNGACLMQINYAKSMGKQASDVAGFAANQLKSTWNRNGGWMQHMHKRIRTKDWS